MLPVCPVRHVPSDLRTAAPPRRLRSGSGWERTRPPNTAAALVSRFNDARPREHSAHRHRGTALRVQRDGSCRCGPPTPCHLAPTRVPRASEDSTKACSQPATRDAGSEILPPDRVQTTARRHRHTAVAPLPVPSPCRRLAASALCALQQPRVREPGPELKRQGSCSLQLGVTTGQALRVSLGTRKVISDSPDQTRGWLLRRFGILGDER